MASINVELGGFYTYTSWASVNDDGTVPKFSVTINEADSTIQGSGADKPGTFAIAGFLIGNEVRFIKQYYNSNGNVAWKYVGKRLDPKGNVYVFSGGWGQGSAQNGQWVLSGVAAPAPQKPKHPIEGQWVGNYQYANNVSQQDGPMSLTISLDGSVSYVADGPYSLTGTGVDGIGSFTIKGTINKDNEFDVTKTYTANGRTWSWRYQALFDESGGIGGIWREIGDDAATPRGSFQLSRKDHLPIATARSIIPQSRTIANATSTPTVQSAVKALESKGTKVPAAALQALLTGFTSI